MPAGKAARPPRGAALLAAALLATLLLALAPPPARAQRGYIPCLGCAEHQEIQTRWHRPFLAELAGEGVLLFNHFRLEADARQYGLCESDILIRSALAVNGCHPYSARRAWLIEAPLELALFTSPAWGLQRRGHPRWALALELLPIAYHAFSASQTAAAIHQWQRQQYLFH
ncbi:MAG TPA: hypothetical protein VMV31_10020 [Terriglobales bacterium]|nr:hypothetical protein [Terriglobales bacterium]